MGNAVRRITVRIGEISRLAALAATVLIAGLATACGDADGNIELPFDWAALETGSDDTASIPPAPVDTASDSAEIPEDSDSPDTSMDCRAVQWGSSCKTGNRIYNLAFEGIEAATARELAVSFENLGCEGYRTALIVAGDLNCSACPAWYEAVGDRKAELAAANSAVIAISTAGLGVRDLSNADALDATEAMNPDYAVGSDPFVFPCRYGFTPYSLLVNLRTAEILGQDTSTGRMSLSAIVRLAEEANRSGD